MGAVDLVIQVESPRSVARGMQRIGRAGHQVGAPSRGRIFPKYRGDLLECAAVVARMRARRDRGDARPAPAARRAGPAARGHLLRRAAGRSTSCEALVAGRLPVRRALARAARGRARHARRAATPPTSSPSCARGWCGTAPPAPCAAATARARWRCRTPGTIPDRGPLRGGAARRRRRVGELDEEMVYEARTGQTFMLGASTWRIEEITRDRVVVTPAPGRPRRRARSGRARASGARTSWARPSGGWRASWSRPDPSRGGRAPARRERLRRARRRATWWPTSRTRRRPPAPCRATARSWSSASATRSATGACACSRPFGARVHAPVGAGAAARASARETGQEAHTIWGDDGIALHLPDADERARRPTSP